MGGVVLARFGVAIVARDAGFLSYLGQTLAISKILGVRLNYWPPRNFVSDVHAFWVEAWVTLHEKPLACHWVVCAPLQAWPVVVWLPALQPTGCAESHFPIFDPTKDSQDTLTKIGRFKQQLPTGTIFHPLDLDRYRYPNSIPREANISFVDSEIRITDPDVLSIKKTTNMASTTAANGVSSPADYDLMLKIAPLLDRHMIFPLLEFSASQLVDEETGDVKDETKAREIVQAKYSLLKKTNMTDYVANLYCELEGLEEPPAEYAEKKQKLFSQLETYDQQTKMITELLERDDVVNNLRSDKVANLEFLKRDHGVSLFWALRLR